MAVLERRVEELGELVRILTTVVEADVESLKITDAEVARHGRQLTPGARWPSPARQPPSGQT